MTVKISELPGISVASLLTADVSAIPVVAGDDTLVTYQTSVANVKSYVETGNLNVVGAVNANLTSTFANLIITGNLSVQGTTTSTSSENLSTNSSVIDLHTFSSDLGPWTSDDGRDIGLRFFWYKGSAAGTSAIVWENDTGYLTWYGSGVGNANTGAISGTLGTIQTGELILSNSTATTSATTGALQVGGGAAVGGNLWVVGNVDGKGYVSATGAGTFSSLRINNSATFGGAISAAGSATALSLQVNSVATIGATLVTSGTATVNALISNGNISGTNISGTAITGTAFSGTSASFTSTGYFGSTLTVVGSATVNSLASLGTITGTALSGTSLTLSGAAITSGAATIQSLVVNNSSTLTGNITTSGTTTVRDIQPSANISYNIGTLSTRFANVYALNFSGQSTTALYADLAEKYEADADYSPGTVVIFGGNKEITITDLAEDVRVAGVISTAPAYLMNSESTGLPVALRGKVPINVIGPVKKGSLLVTSTTAGYAKAISPDHLKNSCAVIAKSLVEDLDTSPRSITAVIV